MSGEKKTESESEGAASRMLAPLEKVAGELYSDGFKGPVQEIGKTAESILRLAFSPIRRAMDWVHERISARIDKKLRGVPPEARLLPPGELVIPTMLNYSYLGEDESRHPELRDMYASLLASAMDPEQARKAHPAFATMISQMTPVEAKIVKYARDTLELEWPMLAIDLEVDPENGDKRMLGAIFKVCDDSGLDWRQQSVAMVNLARLGIFELAWQMICQNARGYIELQDLIFENEDFRNQPIRTRRGTTLLTGLGGEFMDACVR